MYTKKFAFFLFQIRNIGSIGLKHVYSIMHILMAYGTNCPNNMWDKF